MLPVVFFAALAVSLAAVFVLVPVPSMPASPMTASLEEVDVYTEHMLDATWASAGLPESERPATGTGDVVGYERWSTVVDECMADAGFEVLGYTTSSRGGYQLHDSNGEPIRDADEQLAWYDCVARYPLDPVSTGELVSKRQMDFRYRYFLRWTIPCLAAQGMDIPMVPSRTDLVDNPGFSWWTPMSALAWDSTEQYDQAAILCGPTEPAL